MNLENSLSEISSLINEHEEWLLAMPDGRNFAVRRGEMELESKGNRILLGFSDGVSFQVWRVLGCEPDGRKLILNLERNFAKEKLRLELIPRIYAKELEQTIELARIEMANKIAALIISEGFGKKLIRVELNKENGRVAQIIFAGHDGKEKAALFDVTETIVHESLLSSAILWLSRLSARKKKPIDEICIIAEPKTGEALSNLRALLKDSWGKHIKIIEFKNWELKELPSISLAEILSSKAPKIKAIKRKEVSDFSKAIVQFAPDEIDSVFTRAGETLCYRGLPFARVRKIFGKEKVWFGIENKRRLLSESNREELYKLLENLKEYRRHDSSNKHHQLYRLAPESWLESALRKNIKLLDANLILSPIYNQLRVSADKIDLLALRKDGRLVVIELKVAADREMTYQAVDYWRKVEIQRLAGNIRKSGMFGDKQISDNPAIIYLAAPGLEYHASHRFLASTILEDIEIHKFNLNENWRAGMKVLSRDI